MQFIYKMLAVGTSVLITVAAIAIFNCRLSYSLQSLLWHYCVFACGILLTICTNWNENVAWFFPAFWPWYGFSVPVVSYYRIVTSLESRAAPRSLLNPVEHLCLRGTFSNNMSQISIKSKLFTLTHKNTEITVYYGGINPQNLLFHLSLERDF